MLKIIQVVWFIYYIALYYGVAIFIHTDVACNDFISLSSITLSAGFFAGLCQTEEGGHVFISYQMKYETSTVYKIRDCLEAQKYKVWIDVKNMNRTGTVLGNLLNIFIFSFHMFICKKKNSK